MKNIMKVLVLAIGVVACQPQKPINDEVVYNADLQDLPGLNREENFSATLLAENGAEITNHAAIRPNTVYQLEVKSEENAYFRIRGMDGFKLLKNPVFVSPQEGGAPTKKAVFCIRTNQDISAGISFSITPLQVINGRLHREKAKNFLFNSIN